MSTRLAIACLVFLAMVWPVQPAAGQTASYDFCVACAAPQAVYVCTVVPRDPDPGARAWGSFCAEQARTIAGHRNCSAQVLAGNCQATRALVYRGPSASRQQAEALLSPEPGRRSSAAAQIWEQTLANMRALGGDMQRGAAEIGEGVARSAGTVTTGARDVSQRIWNGVVAIGKGAIRGTGCIVTLGARC